MRISSKWLAVAGLLLATGWPQHAGAQLTPAAIRATLRGQSHAFVQLPGSGQIMLVGTITIHTAAEFKRELAADRSIHTLIVDSNGGWSDSAMDMAALIRERKMRLVVDGRCLSACANYLFPAAVTRSVLPGSIVAIHGASFVYMDGEQVKMAPHSQAEGLSHLPSVRSQREDLKRTAAREAAFYQQLGLHRDTDVTFAHYLAHRKRLLGTDMIQGEQRAPGCPPVQMWAMDKAQWEAAGVRGIDKFWFPVNAEQQKQVSRDLGLPAEFFYFGDAAGLEALCTQAPSLRVRMERWLGTVKTAVASVVTR